MIHLHSFWGPAVCQYRHELGRKAYYKHGADIRRTFQSDEYKKELDTKEYIENKKAETDAEAFEKEVEFISKYY